MKHIRFDWAIQKSLRDKVNFVILEGFLTELIGESLTIESILESESNPLAAKTKPGGYFGPEPGWETDAD